MACMYLFALLLALASCPNTIASKNGLDKCVWTWVTGPNISNIVADDILSARCCTGSWQHGETLYLFGGGSNCCYYADVWKFNSGASKPVWSAVTGPSVHQPNFGGNKSFPAARTYPITWTRETGDDVEFWMWGGFGSTNNGDAVGDYLSDLWHWSLRTGTWTEHHPKGRTPQLRKWSNFWSTHNGDMAWVHSGAFLNTTSYREKSFSDMWLYEVSRNAWTQIYSYKNKGVSYNGSSANPGARDNSYTVTTNDTLWLIGGEGRVTAPNGTTLDEGDFQDVWSFNTSARLWTHVAGPTHVGGNASYGTQGVPAASNLPPAMHAGYIFSTPSNDQLWFMGGENGSETIGMRNSLWSYDYTDSGMWTWQTGQRECGSKAHYGTRGHADSTNTPGARYAGQGWATEAGLWMFGGFGFDANNTAGYLGDTWSVKC